MQPMGEASGFHSGPRQYGLALAMIAALVMLVASSHHAAHALEHDHEETEEACISCLAGASVQAKIVPLAAASISPVEWHPQPMTRGLEAPVTTAGLHVIRSRSPPHPFSSSL